MDVQRQKEIHDFHYFILKPHLKFPVTSLVPLGIVQTGKTKHVPIWIWCIGGAGGGPAAQSLHGEQCKIDRRTVEQTDRQTDRQADRQTGRQTDRETERRRGRETERRRDRETNRQRDGETDRETERHRDRETE